MITIPTRLDLVRLLPPGSILAEIGTYRAYFAIDILNHAPNVAKLFCIDPWANYEAYAADTINGEDQEANMREALHHLRGHLPGGRVKVIRGFSAEVARDNREIPPLTAVYIDGNHSYESCLEDLLAWEKRLAPDGVILGHDFTANETAQRLKFGVIKAVEEFCRTRGWKHTHITDEDFASYRLEREEFWTGAEA